MAAFIFLLSLFGLFTNQANSATFENVTVLLSTQLRKLFTNGRPPIDKIFIRSSDTLGDYINLQPLEVLTIRNQYIPQLIENSVSNLPHTVHLSIISSGIKEIEPGTFHNVPKLEGLNLEGNFLEEVKNGVFTGLSIRNLYLNDNKIKEINDAAFNNMTMTLISLNNNQISRWNSDWFLGTPVGSIYMANNLVEEIPANAFAYGLQFKRINVPLNAWHVVLAKNRLKKIHPDAFKHVNGFGFLSFADNDLEILPERLFDSVKNIHTFDLSNNKLVTVHGLFDDINIYQLILVNNTLRCFPTEVFDISKINYIFVDGNPFTCKCVDIWREFQIRSDAWVLYNMKKLENSCVEK